MHTVGLDEVGRGCWAGPLTVGAVVLAGPIEGLRDSKLLNKRRREYFSDSVHQLALSYSLGWVSALEIDTLGLTEGARLAYRRALAKIGVPIGSIIIDGNYNFLSNDVRATTLIKADQTIPAVSAASIVAKVARDRYMAEMAVTYPGYGFERHVGYGTTAHRTALRRLGPCDLHRRSFRPLAAGGL